MLVKDAKNIAKQWVESEASKTEGYCGAFIFGSVNWMNDDDPFPLTSDIDVRVVLDMDKLPPSYQKASHDGTIIDLSYARLSDLRPAQAVLSHYPTAAHFTRPCILTDPTGYLSQLQGVVEKEFSRRKWVEARVQGVMDWQSGSLEMFLNKADPFHDQVFAWIYPTSLFAHWIIVADLKNPTVRKGYVAARDVLKNYDELAFHEKLLTMLGSANLTREQVETLLNNCAEVFDIAKNARSTGFFGSSTISDTGYPTAIGGIDELIKGGSHREAVFWLIVIHTWCQKILYNDASQDIKNRLMPQYDVLMSAIGINSLEDVYERIEQTKAFRQETKVVADSIMQRNPQIFE